MQVFSQWDDLKFEDEDSGVEFIAGHGGIRVRAFERDHSIYHWLGRADEAKLRDWLNARDAALQKKNNK